MSALALAGCLAPRGGDRGAALVAALHRDGPAAVAHEPPFTVAWTPASEPRRGICVIDGRARTEALAGVLGLEPGSEPERLVLAGFARFGAGVVERLGGSFALALWDPERGGGLLARDRIGTAPLFMAQSQGALLFASEVRTLLALLPSRPGPDGVALRHWLARTRSADSGTLYSGIRRLPAAHLVELDAGGWREPHRYWSPRYAPPGRVGAADAAEAVRDGLSRAVGRCMEGSRSPALMLSGGFDSAAVAATAGRPLPAYSAVFPHEPAVDESERVARVREWLALDGVELRFEHASALAAAARFTREWELPSVSPNLFVWDPLLARAAADGVDVLLDGEGGDELFGCARFLIADRLRSGRPLSALWVARSLPGMGERPLPRWIGRALVSYGLRANLPEPVHARMRALRGRGSAGPPWLATDEDRLHRTEDDPWAWKRAHGPRWWAELAHTLTVTGDAIGAPDQLRREARGAGIELRHPLRDPELIDLVLGLPPELAFDPDQDRPLARRALARALPPATLAGGEKPTFNSLLGGALDGRDRATLVELLADPHPELARRVRAGALRALLDGPHTGAGTIDLWRLASAELWLRHCEDPQRGLERFAADGDPDSISFKRIPAPARQL